MTSEIKRQNRKALPGFILIFAASIIVGGVVGFFIGHFGSESSMDQITESLRNIGVQFGSFVAPYLLIALAIILPIVVTSIYRNAKKLYQNQSEEDDIYDVIDRKLSIAIMLDSIGMIISMFLLTTLFIGMEESLEREYGFVLYMAALAAFFAVLIGEIITQQKIVDLTKEMNPEKNGSVYDMKFQKKWMDSCDEAEKAMVGQCAYKAYIRTNTTCNTLAVVLAICALVFHTGFLAPLAVCVIWLVNIIVYIRESMRLTGKGSVL